MNREEVRAFGEAIRADVATLPMVTVGDLVSGNDGSWDVPIIIDGALRLRLQFFDEAQNAEWHQALDAVDQLQDSVIQDTRETWPLCEIHRDVLVPTEYPDGSIWWVCDRSCDIAIPLGSLNSS
jgi:hypothetical protein